jgi:muramoyltetrapeptide carboxypeptidase
MPLSIKPHTINKGDTIAFIAPAGPVTVEQLVNARQKFETLGFRVIYKERILDRKGYLAGTDKDRLDELHWAFANQEVNMVLCFRGGYGCSRIVDKIDFELIKKNPKLFVGFSDITVLLNAIWKKTGLVTFHGVVANSGFSEYTSGAFMEIVDCKIPNYKIKNHPNSPIDIISPGIASGILVGGNLSLIASLMGTDYELDFTDKLVFIEDIDEAPYKIDRMLTQLLLAGKLQKAAGIILGNFRACDIDNIENGLKKSLSLIDVFFDRLACLNIPVLTGFSFGHIENQAVFPVGIMAEMDTNEQYIKLLENPVC